MSKFVEKPHKVRYLPDIRDIICYGAEHYGERPAFEDRHFPGQGDRRSISYRQLKEDVDALGTALLNRGLEGKKIAVMSENRYDWALTYFAVCCGVGVIIPLDRELPPAELVNLLRRAEASALVYSKKQQKTVDAAMADLDFVEYLIEMDGDTNQWRNLSLKKLVEEGYALIAEGDDRYMNREIDPKALMAIYFTSGTTGTSKGVMLSHRNLTSNVENMLRRMYIDTKARGLLVLPVHHTFAFTCEVLPGLTGGATIVIADGLKYIQRNLKEDRVNTMLGVPLIYETFHRKILISARHQGKEEKLLKGMRLNEKLQKIGIDRSRKMFKDIYVMIGNEIQTFIVGGAPMDPEIIRDFRALGINMFEGYGLTETSPIIAVNADYRQKTGTVGPPMPGTQVRIADPDEDGIGEIQALTESTMIGYYQDPEETAKVLLPDGWFATGDYGFLDKEGFLHVTGRKKNVIVTKNGKNIYPEELEYLLDKSEYIKESVVWGKEDPDGGDLKITAEIVIDTEALQGKTPEEIQALIDGEVERVNAATTSYKRIKRFNIREEEFEKTTTRKIRRHTIDYK